MGVSCLWTLLEPCKEATTLEKLAATHHAQSGRPLRVGVGEPARELGFTDLLTSRSQMLRYGSWLHLVSVAPTHSRSSSRQAMLFQPPLVA